MLWFSQVFENINIADRNYITEMEFLKLVFSLPVSKYRS